MNRYFTLSCDVCNAEKSIIIRESGIPVGDVLKFIEKHEYHMGATK